MEAQNVLMGWQPLPVKAQINHGDMQICFLIPAVKEQRRIGYINRTHFASHRILGLKSS